MGIFLFVFFNVVFFILGYGSTSCSAVWVAYVFVNIACLCDIVSSLLISDKEATWAAAAIPLKVLSKTWIVVMLIVCSIIMMLEPNNWHASLIVLLFISVGFIGIGATWFKKHRDICNQQ